VSRLKYGLLALAAGLALMVANPPAQAVEVEITEVFGVPFGVEILLDHEEVEAISLGQEIPLPPPWDAAVALVANLLSAFDEGDGVKVIVPWIGFPIWVEPR
jgi:hypothetical protein